MGKNSLMFFTRILVTGLLAGVGAAQAKPLTCDLAGAVAGDQGERVQLTAWHNDSSRVSMDMMAVTFANPDGVFTFKHLPWFSAQQWGQHKVIVVARSKSRIGMFEVHNDRTDTGNLHIPMRQKVNLRGRLLDRVSGKPIVNGWIWPSIFGKSHEVWATEPLLPWLARTDEQGRFVLKGLPKGLFLKALAGGPDHARTWIDIEDSEQLLTSKLPRGGRITGRVLNPDGTPAARVQVNTSSTEGGRGHALSNDQGEYTLTSLGPGRYKVWAEVDDLTCIAATDLAVTTGTVLSKQTVQLVKGGFIVGRIVDANTGKPIVPGPHTDVAMYGPARGDGGSCQRTPVQADGTFRIRAPAGKNRIYLRAAMGYKEPSEFVQVVEGQETEVVWEVTGKRR